MNDKIMNKTFEQIRLFDKPVLFTPSRMDAKDLPKGIYMYELRHDDECQGIIVELSTKILVNYWGTIISNKPIQLDRYGYREIDEDYDIDYLCEPRITLPQYINKQRYKETQR